MKPWAAVALILSMATCAGQARADIVPPPDHQCSIEKVAGPAESCTSCRASRSAPEACRDKLASNGYQHRCSAQGAEAWTEIWCVEPAPELPPAVEVTPAATRSSGAPATSLSATPLLASPAPSATPDSAVAPGADPEPHADEPLPTPRAGRGCGSCALGPTPAPRPFELLGLLVAGTCLALRRRR